MTLRRVRVVRVLMVAAVLIAAASPSVASATTSYTSGTPSVDGVLNGPWNTSQGDASAGSAYQLSDLFPTYTPGGNTTTLGGPTEPNLAVYPAATAAVPYPTGVAGTPGPLDGYCSSLGANPETGSPASEPSGLDLPFAPYYFPDVVRNSDGSLTGYFDWRPKDADEGITVAKSTDGGLTWNTEGEALEQNGGYCPTADTNDDGQGHPFVTTIGSSTDLYTLQRQAGDNLGIGLLVNQVNPSATNPLSAVPASQPVGIDPNTFVTGTTTVPTTGGVSVPVSTLGTAGTPEQIVNGSYEDVPAGNSEPSSSTIINCTGPTSAPGTAGPGSLTGCTSATGSSVTVNPGDDLIQVIATGNPTSSSGSRDCATIGNLVPSAPNNPAGTGGLSALCYSQPSTPVAPITDSLWGSLAPNRVYMNGETVYCNGVSSGLVKLENCTTTGAPFNYTAASEITGDPIIPPTATMTTGLVAPDGMVGTVPYRSTFNGTAVPANATIALYTEKILNYYMLGTTNGKITSSGTFSSSTITLPLSSTQELNFQPSVTTTEPLPSSGGFTIYVGVTDSSGNFIQALSCTSWAAATQSGAPAGSIDVSGCTGGTSAETVVAATDVGGPNAAITPGAVLNQIGEGKVGSTSGPTELFGNNEDYTVLRAAYTTNGVNFTDLGPISGTFSAAGNNTGGYNDVSNPNQQFSPTSSASPTTATLTPTAPTNLAAGNSDQIELRYVGSRGTIITNPDGSLGMFLSGSWSSDGDSDAFNQIFYTSSTDGVHWTPPVVVLSTDYTFAASLAQDTALQGGMDDPLGVSAYYSGRAYGPSIVQNPNGTLTMLFAGYRLPKPITAAATLLGTHTGAQYDIGSTDPALYRNILTATISSSTSPAVPTTSTLSPATPTLNVGTSQTFTDTVTVNSPGTGTPTGTINFFVGGSPIAQCQNVALSDSAPDQATCATSALPISSDDNVTAVYSGDSNYATSTGSATAIVVGPPTAAISSPANDQTYNVGASVPTSFSCSEATNGPGIQTCADSNGGSGTSGTLNTATPGTFTYTVMATSLDGQTATASISYTVVGPPTAAISSPANDQTYNVGASVPTSFSCSEATNGPGIEFCADSNGGSGTSGTLNTATPGTFTYTVMATSLDGQTATASISYTVVGPPTAAISSPANDQTYNVGASVPTSFSCSEATNGPGIEFCADSNGGSGTSGTLNTATPGTFTYTVMATSLDGQTATASISYTVVGPPTAAISGPAKNQSYNVGQSVPTSFSCSEAANGPGIASCSDSNGATGGTGSLNTSQAGTFTYTVTARSQDGQSASASISYTVVPPGTPTGNACDPADGQIEGRGSTYQANAQALWWNAYGADICGATPATGTQSTAAGNNMGIYNYTALAGSGAGLKAANCRTDAYAGTDLPYTTAQLTTGLDGAPGNAVIGGCSGSTNIPSPLNFPPDLNTTATFPNSADLTAKIMSFPVAGSSVTLDVNLTAAECGGSTGALDFTPQQLSDLMGGNILNWDNPELRNNGENGWLASCNEPVSRVVRYDDSGTTGILKGYFLNVDSDRTGATCDPSPWSNYDNPTLSTNAIWPTNGTATGTGDGTGGTGVGFTATSSCSAVVSGQAGGNAVLLQTLVNTPGGIGYADLADEEVDSGTLPGGGTGLFNSVLLRSAVESATDPGSYVGPESIKGANCDFSAMSLPEGGAATGMVGLDVPASGVVPPDTWADDNPTNHENATDQGSRYPICGLTFDLVYTGLSANWNGQSGTASNSAIADLTPDQRRTLYSYILFILSSTGQNLLPTNYYSALPSTWLPAIVSGFQGNY